MAITTKMQITAAILFCVFGLKKFISALLWFTLIIIERNVTMPLFFICFIVFVFIFRVKIRKNDSTQTAENEAFWERENRANFSRTRDISQLDYITVPEGALPYSITQPITDEREEDLEQQVKDTSKRKMLNLSAYTNTDLKEQYGVANLEELSNCDQNFLLFIRSLANWGVYLYEKNDIPRAKQIMEYSLSIGSDISSVYITLGHIYAKEDNIHKIDELIATVEQSDFALKATMLKQLTLCKLE